MLEGVEVMKINISGFGKRVERFKIRWLGKV